VVITLHRNDGQFDSLRFEHWLRRLVIGRRTWRPTFS
jgi:hypothetical protein